MNAPAASRHPRPAVIEAVVVNWNSGADLEQIVTGLRAQRNLASLRILVVDNGSTDDSLEQARRAVPDLEAVRVGTNLGYTGGNNLGFAHLGMSDLVLVCTPGVELSDPETLSRLASALDADPTLAAVAPMMIKDDGQPEYTYAQLNLRIALVGLVPRHPGLEGLDAVCLNWIDGGLFLARGAALRSVGGFDDRFYLFDDEVDLAIRLRERGWRVALVPGARVRHRRNSSFGTSRKGSYYYWRNMYLLCRIHAPGTFVWRAAWAARFVKNLLDPNHIRAKRSGPMILGALDALRGRFGAGPEDRPPPPVRRQTPVA